MSARKTCFVTGGCGFVGRHLTQRLLKDGHNVWILDDLSTGKNPADWLLEGYSYWKQGNGLVYFRKGGQKVVFIQDDALSFLTGQLRLGNAFGLIKLPRFDDVFHLASVVGGRAVIEGDPMAVAIDLAIDSIFFRWLIVNNKRIGRVLFASSSAAYPIHLQAKGKAVALKERYISFDKNLGMPDMTYGWSKLTGEYLSQVAAKVYGISIACVRPFSGYGGDQDQTYPVPAIARRAAGMEDPLVVWGTEIAGYSPVIKPLIDKPEGVQSRYSNPSNMKRVLKWSPEISLVDGFSRVLKEQQLTVKK
jgi:nucleoside-diphosphate-sugar epimerase